jgi:hypothetical protein
MDKLFFAAFIVASSFVAGVSVFDLWLNARLYRTNRKARRPLVFIKSGFIITSAVLLEALITAGASPSTWRSWAYLLGVIVTGIGLAMVTLNDIEESAERAVKKLADDTAQAHEKELPDGTAEEE